MTIEKYLELLEQDIFSKNLLLDSGGQPSDIRPYFHGHLPRFKAHLEMFKKHLDGEQIRRVYDLGTGVPFASYYFNVTQGAEVLYGMPEQKNQSVNEKVKYLPVNLCTPPADLQKADLVVCTECLEHLPCPLLAVINYLKGLVKQGKYLLLSFPFGSIRKGGLEADFGEYEKIRHEHLREFDNTTARKVLEIIGWEMVAEKLTFTSAYGGDIWNVLLKNKKGKIMASKPKPKVLITGSEGLLGKWIAQEFRKQGTEFVGYDLVAGQNIFDEDKLVAAMDGCTAVLHLAVYPDRGAAPDEGSFLHLNHEGALAVFKAAEKAGVKRFIYCSTGNVYCFGDGLQDDKQPPIEVTDTPDPELVHPYPKSKLLTEKWLKENRGSMQVLVLRPNCLYPTPEPYYSQWRGATITRERLARYFHNAAVRTVPQRYVILDVIEPTGNYPGSLKAQELLD